MRAAHGADDPVVMVTLDQLYSEQTGTMRSAADPTASVVAPRKKTLV